MNLDWLAGIIGGGGVLTALAASLLYVTKGAIATAVTQAGAREIETLKGDLAKELEAVRARFMRELADERQAFERVIELERKIASRDLERFKSELSLEAEARRQVVTARHGAIAKIVEEGNALARTYIDLLDLGEEMAKSRFSDACLTLSVLVRGSSHLFPESVGLQFERHVQEIWDVAQPGFSRCYQVPPPELRSIPEVTAVKAHCFALTNFARTLLPSEADGAAMSAREA